MYDLLEVIRKKPGIFRHALTYAGTPLDPEQPPFGGFHNWIAMRLGLSSSAPGWRAMLIAASADEAAACERFYLELDEFRRQTVH